MRHSLNLALAICSLAACSIAQADFRADYTAVKDNGGQPMLSRIELSGKHLRTDAGNVSMLFDGDSDHVYVLIHDKKHYMDMEKMAELAGAAMAQTQSVLANLPPAQRAMIEKQMGKRLPGPSAAKVDVSVTPTGAQDRVGKYACEVYATTINGERSAQTCLTSFAAAGISATDGAAVRSAFEKLKSMTEKMSEGMFKSPLSNMPLNRFPVRITTYNQGQAQTVELKSLSSSNIPATEFAIPAGYTEQSLGSMGHGR